MLAFAVLLAAAAPNLKVLVSRADLHYDAPAPRSEDGMPLGNGRMGSLVWTTPHSVRFQINRNDIYPIDSASTSFFERHQDYCGGAAFADIDFGGEPLIGPGFSQRLGLYDGTMEVAGDGLRVRLRAWHARDVFAVEVTDTRARPQPVHVSLRMLRFAVQYAGGDFEPRIAERAVAVRTFHHVATSRLHGQGDTIALTQEFREGEHYNASAVAARIVGRPARIQFPHESEVRLEADAGHGSFLVLIGSAASFDPKHDVRAEAESAVTEAAGKGHAALADEVARGWQSFWTRGFVDLRSPDGTAESVADKYHYFLYLMAASSRGDYPAKFNGMLWNTRGDVRAWGGQHWFANLSCYYEALFAANRLELLDPMFRMYGANHDAYARAARDQWGSQGIYIPETTWFDGLAPLPEEIAAEMRELYLLRKPWEERSATFRSYARARHPQSSRWNWNAEGRWVDGVWEIKDRGFGPFGHVNHILGTTAKVAYLFWRRYEFTLDRDFLERHAYPMLKGAADFYRHFPNLVKGEDGRYHIQHVNSNESVMGARDTDEDLSAMRGIFAAAIRAAEILDVDADRRADWRERLEHLAPLPTSADAGALWSGSPAAPPVFVRGRTPAVNPGRGGRPDGNSLPMWFFDLVSLESDDRVFQETARATFEASYERGIGPETPVGVLSRHAIAGALLGRPEAARHLVPNQMRSWRAERDEAYGDGRPLQNLLALREGHQALDAQRLGRAAEALHLALLQSQPPGPAREPVLRLFPAWPKEWDASVQLRARGAFLVRASIRDGRVQPFEIESLAGATCRLRNPWGEGRLVVRREGVSPETRQGSLIELKTRAGERLTVAPAD